MKIRKIIAKSNEEIAILVKKGHELISITIDSKGNIEVNGFGDDMVLLEEIANLQLKNQQMENNLIDTIMRIENIYEKTFMKDEEE